MEIWQGDAFIASGGRSDFGSVGVDTENDLTLAIKNTGGGMLILTGTAEKVDKTGTDAPLFTILSQPDSPVSPGGNTAFLIRFKTPSDGAKTATLAIASNDPEHTSYTLTIAGSGLVPASPIPRTGMALSQGAGDDGSLQKGASWPSPRFEEKGNGTVADKLTGLVWEKSPSTTKRTWAGALTYANELALGGTSSWRLPNIHEIESLTNAAESHSAAWLNTQGFTNVQGDYYWSSTTFAPDTDSAWVVDMGYGSAGTSCLGSDQKASALRYAWAVCDGDPGVIALSRTGQTATYSSGDDGELGKGVVWPSPRFLDNGNGTVTDLLTGLMWRKVPSFTFTTWADALGRAGAVLLAGYSDWRLPNRRELGSMIDCGKSNSANALGEAGFVGLQSSYYWSSTPYPVGTSHAWIMFLSEGQVFLEYQTPSPSFWHLVWEVRGG